MLLYKRIELGRGSEAKVPVAGLGAASSAAARACTSFPRTPSTPLSVFPSTHCCPTYSCCATRHSRSLPVRSFGSGREMWTGPISGSPTRQRDSTWAASW